MADRTNHSLTFPKLHWIYSSPRPSYTLGSTILGKKLLRNPTLFAQRTSFQASANSSSSLVTPNKQMHPVELNTDNTNHSSTFSEFHRIYASPRPSCILGSTILEKKLLRNPALFTQRTSFQASTNSSSSSLVIPNKQMHPGESNPVSYNILQGISKVMSGFAYAPLQRVYVLMQCQNEMLKSGHSSIPYKGVKDCLITTIKHEGVLSLWRGNSLNVIPNLVMEGLAFKACQLGNKGVLELPLWAEALLPLPVFLLCYAVYYAQIRLNADVKAARKLLFSLDSSRNSLRNAVGNRKFSGVRDVFKKTLQSDGIMGLYRGATLALVGISAFCLARDGIKSHCRAQKQTKEKLAFWTRVEPVILIGLAVVFYPVETVYNRMMLTSGEAIKYKGVVDAIRQIVKHEGVSSLYRGVAAFAIYQIVTEALIRE